MGRILGICALVLLTTAALAQTTPTVPPTNTDYHLAQDPAQRLFRLSPFAHGYIHGYESGFTLGDEDVQMGRGDQRIEHTGEFKDADRGYRREFGDRGSFRSGFREGLVIGYRDAISGGEFRAFGELRRLATGLENSLVGNAADHTYDGGFLAGYTAARQGHPDDCQNADTRTKARFCSGYLDGYDLGVSDSGAVAQAVPTVPIRKGPKR